MNDRSDLRSLVAGSRSKRLVSEAQQRGADTLMIVPLTTENNIDVTMKPTRKFRRKAFCVSGKTLVVIHPELVKSLRIDDDTWFDEVETESGVSLAICNSCEQGKTKDCDQHSKS